MVKVLLPPKPDIPEPPPGMVLSLMPAKHLNWLDDYELFDQLGRDPLQQARLWLIADPGERVAKLDEVLEAYPKDGHRRYMLAQAAHRGDEAVVRRLVANGMQVHADAPTEEEQEADRAAKENGEIPERGDVDLVPLHVAAAEGHLGCVRIMVEEGHAPVNSQNQIGYTPVSLAAAHPDVVRYLLDKGADPTIATPPHDKSTEEEEEEEEAANHSEVDALVSASRYGNFQSIKLLLEHPVHGPGEKREMKSHVGQEPGVWVTPQCIVGVATCKSDSEALKLLLQRGGFPMEARDGKTKSELLTPEQESVISDAVPIAAEQGSLEALKLLLGYTWPEDLDGNLLPFELPEHLHKPFVYGAYSALRHLDSPAKFEFLHSFGMREHETMSLSRLPAGQNLNVQHLLEKAAEGNSTTSVRLMVDKYGADPNAHRMPPAIKPLFFAAARDSSDVVRLLLEEYGADIHLGSGRYATGPTALHIAVILKALPSVELLLRHGGPVDHVDDEIRHVSAPMTVVLKADADFGTYDISSRLETRENAKQYLDKWKADWQDQNPPFVLLEIESDDREWIDRLQTRRPEEELRETGDGARELNHREAVSDSELGDNDLRRYTTPFPSVDDDIVRKLKNDDDLLPRWEPHLVPAV